MAKIVLSFVFSIVLSVLITPLVIKLSKKLACSQTILKYVEEHKSKQGTATLGGLVFFAVTFLTIFWFLKYNTDWFLCLLVGASYGLLGGMDDFIKIKFKRNLGLRPYQKIIGQVGIAIIFAFYIFYNVSTNIYIPFINTSINLGWLIIPFVVLVFLATTNAVNLTDGLDGLAGSVSVIVMLVGGLIIYLTNKNLDMVILLTIFAGAILGFLVFNTNKASIFMGDLGSLGIGGTICAVFCLNGLQLSLLLLGFCFVASTLSVIIQVAVFKKTKKRVFKMSPIHHHFQQLGFSENKITYCYSLLTLVLGLILILSYL